MPGLTVYLNRDGLNTVETDQTAVRATESVDIVLENHGKPTHVHLHLDDDLATLGTITDPHWFVPKEEWREAELTLTPAAEGRGRLEVTTGYGQEQTTVDVDVEPVDEAESGSETIDTVGGPSRKEPVADTEESTGVFSELDTERLRNPVVLATLGAFLVMLVLLLFVNPLSAIAAGFAALLGAIAVGSYVTAWDPFAEESEDS
ncbi:MAG: hypothetical protein ACLFNC_00140 [Halodesulfurarchaeum sp.]